MPSPEPAHRVDVAREFPPYRSATAAQAHAGARSAWKRPSTSSCPPEEITFGIVAIAKGYGGGRLSVVNGLLRFFSPRIVRQHGQARPFLICCRRARHGRDGMGRKRAKRASDASAGKSKRRGKARAAATEAKPKGVINAWEQDPGDGAQPSGGQVIQRPVPVLREQPFSIRIVNPASAPEAKPHSPGTADFR